MYAYKFLGIAICYLLNSIKQKKSLPNSLLFASSL